MVPQFLIPKTLGILELGQDELCLLLLFKKRLNLLFNRFHIIFLCHWFEKSQVFFITINFAVSLKKKSCGTVSHTTVLVKGPLLAVKITAGFNVLCNSLRYRCLSPVLTVMWYLNKPAVTEFSKHPCPNPLLYDRCQKMIIFE